MSKSYLDLEARRELFTTLPIVNSLFSVEGHELNYHIYGTGARRLVLIMGLLSSMYSWSQIVAYFLETYPGEFSILVFDNRGVGYSTPGSIARYSTSGMAMDIKLLLDSIGWTLNRSLNVVGISMGGMITLELIDLIPDRIMSVALLATCATHRSPPKYYLKAEFVILKRYSSEEARLDGLFSVLFHKDGWLSAVDKKFPEFNSNKEKVVSEFKYRIQNLPKPSLRAFLGQTLAVKTHNVSQARLEKIGKAIPDIVALTGTEDAMIDPACTDHLAKHLNCERVVLDGKGHGVTFEASEDVVLAIEKVLASSLARYSLNQNI